MEVVYRERGSEGVQMTSCVIVTGSEGVSRYKIIGSNLLLLFTVLLFSPFKRDYAY